MFNYTFDEHRIASRLQHISHKSQVAFALACIERMYPNYQAFQNKHGWGDSAVLREAIDLGWQWLESKFIDLAAISKIAAKCEQQAPDTEHFQSLTVSPALDAAIAVSAVMALIQTHEVQKAVEVASLARDTVDMFVQELEKMPPNSHDLEERIRMHSLMQTELQKQENDLAALEAGIALEQLSLTWKSPLVSNIGF